MNIFVLKPFSRLLTLTCFMRDPNRHSRASRKKGNKIRRRTDNKRHTPRLNHDASERRLIPQSTYTHALSFSQTAAAFGNGPDRASQRPRAFARARAGSSAAGAARALARFSPLALSEATTRPTRRTTKRGQYRWPWRQCRWRPAKQANKLKLYSRCSAGI